MFVECRWWREGNQSIMKRCHHSPTMVTLHDTRFVERRWWNDGLTVKTVFTWRSSASMIPAPDLSRVAQLRHLNTICSWFRTRIVYLNYVTCLRCTILARNPRNILHKRLFPGGLVVSPLCQARCQGFLRVLWFPPSFIG